jgi:hypothetical protein
MAPEEVAEMKSSRIRRDLLTMAACGTLAARATSAALIGRFRL